MDGSNKTLMFLQGIALGAVVAAGVTYFLTKNTGAWDDNWNGRKESENGRTRKMRRRSASRSTSPSRRPPRDRQRSQPTNHNDSQGEARLPPLAPNTQRGRPEMMSRTTPPVAVSPRAGMLTTTETTDDETFNDALRMSSDGRGSTTPQGALSDQQSNPPAHPPPLPLATFERPKALTAGKLPMILAQATELGLTKSASKTEFGNMGARERAKALEEAALNEEYCRVITPEGQLTEESEDICLKLIEALDLRDKWLFAVAEEHQPGNIEDLPEAAYPSELGIDPFSYDPLPKTTLTTILDNGIFRIYSDSSLSKEVVHLAGAPTEFFHDLHMLCKISATGPMKTFCHQRLMLLEQKFNLHVMMNSDRESLAQKSAPHRDFYNVRKVDTHVHHSACMHQKHLLRFIKSKLRKEPDEVVIFRDGKYLTLNEVFESLHLTGHDLNVDTLDMHADKNIFHRFDKFNLKYNPCGQSRLREIFIKQDNLIHGRYLAELTMEVFEDLKSSKYQHAEYRISIYGRKQVEWDILAAWICTNELYSDNVVWLIQIPRLYNVYKEGGIVEDFEQMLDNIFAPLFEVTIDPESHPQVHVFLKHVVGFDMVDDESRPERRPSKHMPTPREWSNESNPPYSYYGYYIYANLYVLNKLREYRGLNTFTFRPHAGEAGDLDHLACAYMLCENIAHGINLRKSPCMQYLYYLAKIGLCMSPLSNNSLFLDYHKNPFPLFFQRGLNVSLSTDDPLQIHLTKEPLVEEYSIAAQVWKLSSTDLCEIARNGVLHSGFPNACKKHWVAEKFWKPGPEGNDIQKTNVPNLRLRFREDTYKDEINLLLIGASACRTRQFSSDADA